MRDKMKIIKVIVDEMPENCYCCPYSIYDDESSEYVCLAMIVSTVDNLISDMYARPDWCPLVVERDYNMDLIIRYLDMCKKESEE